jgi:hypothetical protein
MTKGIQIGSVRFDQVEMPILIDQLNKLDEILRAIQGDNLPPAPTPSQQITRETPEADWAGYANRYFISAPIHGLASEYQAIQDEYNQMMEHYSQGDIHREQQLGNAGTMSSLREFWSYVEHNPGRVDDSLLLDLKDSLRVLHDDFAYISRALDRNTGATDRNTDSDRDMTIYANLE